MENNNNLNKPQLTSITDLFEKQKANSMQLNKELLFNDENYTSNLLENTSNETENFSLIEQEEKNKFIISFNERKNINNIRTKQITKLNPEIDNPINNKSIESQEKIDKHRLKQMNKLKDKEIIGEKQIDHQSLIIFDWDDTLLCTTYLNYKADDTISSKIQDILDRLSKAVIEVLTMASQLGYLYIITNGTNGWVEESAQRWIPSVVPSLKNIKIISARSKFENLQPCEHGKWKEQTFVELAEELNTGLVTNLIALGDSNYELTAAKILGKCFDKAYVKTVKFKDAPHPVELINQLELVNSSFDKIYNRAKDLTIRLARKNEN